MGSTGSKNLNSCKEFSENVQSESVKTSPILTPEPRKKSSELDPRSPNPYLSRTPLQFISTPSKHLEELTDSDLYEFNGEICTKGKTILLGLDPRSPTTEFKRTPIVISDPGTDVSKKLHNKNLDNVRRSTIITTPKSTIEKSLPNIIPPKLLESSPIRQKSTVIKRKSFAGLLETNIDFTETDLDVALREKCKLKDNIQNNFTAPTASTSANIVSKNIDPRSPSADFIRTPIQVNRGNCIEEKNICEEHIKRVEMQADDIDPEIEKVVQEICEIIHVKNEICEEKVNDNSSMENMSFESVSSTEDPISKTYLSTSTTDLNIATEINSAPVSPPPSKQQSTFSMQRNGLPAESHVLKQSKSAPTTPPIVNITADVNELDKKLSNLIYQDEDIKEDIFVCPKIVKLKDNSNRSPLRNCNGTENGRKKSMQKLRVSDKPTKSDYVLSKIPVFKEKGKISVHCENTPPRNIEKRKTVNKKSHWDNADKTLII